MSAETPAAIVTGSDSGIGRACAVALARDGFDVAITYSSDAEGAKATADEVRDTGRAAQIAHLDLTDLPAAGDVMDGLIHELGRIDVLVNNAGTGSAVLFIETGYDKLREVLQIDLEGPFVCGQRADRHMTEQGRGGCIINITSVSWWRRNGTSSSGILWSRRGFPGLPCSGSRVGENTWKS
jgi:NAD(P)-dependent dehydrogenase (short-subunit alcohol dehydrogenase family)